MYVEMKPARMVEEVYGRISSQMRAHERIMCCFNDYVTRL